MTPHNHTTKKAQHTDQNRSEPILSTCPTTRLSAPPPAIVGLVSFPLSILFCFLFSASTLLLSELQAVARTHPHTTHAHTHTEFLYELLKLQRGYYLLLTVRVTHPTEVIVQGDYEPPRAFQNNPGLLIHKKKNDNRPTRQRLPSPRLSFVVRRSPFVRCSSSTPPSVRLRPSSRTGAALLLCTGSVSLLLD